MVHEKIFKEGFEKEVKIIVTGFPSADAKKVSKFFEILVRDPGQVQFQNQTGIKLLVPVDVQKADQRLLARNVMALNGVSDAQLLDVVMEFDQIVGSSVLW